MATQEMGDRDRWTSALQDGKVIAVQQRSPKTLGQFPLRPTGGQRRVLALLGQNSLPPAAPQHRAQPARPVSPFSAP